ncbi:methyl-accepting chemotaxis protein [Photobacterium aphoticum]|uniref:Methyl-accepting chemotaxis protein n=1 Tax=Photobacterium aphoticum TaxID=754436 RepID=A0A090R3X4_9GAMM|nr:methyl-accepting chemotaxis protein [Photobacterium aphoticum]
MLVCLLSGCSLLEVKIESQTVPLTQQELNMRLMTREYAQQFLPKLSRRPMCCTPAIRHVIA